MGIGNILQSVDGIGVYIANSIIESGVQMHEGIEVLDGGTAGIDLLPHMRGRDKIIIIDALKVDDRAGTIYRFTPGKVISTNYNIISLHQVGIQEVIKLLRIMGENPEIEIIGIVPEDVETFDIKISDSVLNSVPKAIDLIKSIALT